MKRRRHVSSYSVDYVSRVLVLILIAVVIVSAAVSLYVISLMRRQTIQGFLDTMSLYVSQVDTAHTSINKFLIRSLKEEEYRTALETTDTLELIRAAGRVKTEVGVYMESFQEDYQIFFYNSKHDRLLRPRQAYSLMNRTELDLLNGALLARIEEGASYGDAWEVITVGDKVYFVKIFEEDGCYAGCCISADSITKPLDGTNLGKDGFVALSTGDGTPLTHEDEIRDQRVFRDGGFSSLYYFKPVFCL